MSDDVLKLIRIGKLNNNAIALFQSGKVNDAINVVIHGMTIMKTLFNNDGECKDNEVSSLLSLKDDDPYKSIKTFQAAFLIEQKENQIERNDNQSYERSIEVEERKDPKVKTSFNSITSSALQDLEAFIPYDIAFLCCSDMPFDKISATAVLLYNAGLFHHQLALMNGYTETYGHAITFYNHVMEFFDYIQEKASESTTLTILMAATLHNLSCCYTTAFRDKVGTSDCLDKLIVLVEWMESKYPSILEEEIEFFSTAAYITETQLKSCNTSPCA